jgi:restriction endonuclease Mrr
MNTRANKIFEIIEQSGGRLKVSDIREKLCVFEKISAEELSQSVIPATVRQDNKTRDESGKVKRFNVYGDGDEEWGYVSIIKQVNLETSKSKILGDYLQQFPALIEEANNKVREQLKKKIENMSWQEFESSFLLEILEGLGFSEVEITQRTRDGGKDSICTYKRGLVQSQAIVSAKHWSKKVGVEEIQRIRGIKGEADTGIIVTSNKFSSEAIKEAAPSQNQRSMVLIDGNLIVETCFKNKIFVKNFDLPTLYKFVDIDYQAESSHGSP